MPRNINLSYELQQIEEARKLYNVAESPLLRTVLNRAEFLEHEREQHDVRLEQMANEQTALKVEISALEDTTKALIRHHGEERLADAYRKSQRAKYATMYGLKEEVSN